MSVLTIVAFAASFVILWRLTNSLILRKQVRKKTEELERILQQLKHQNNRLEKEIEELSKLQDTLKKARLDYQTIIDSVPAMIWYVDRNHRIVRANEAAARLSKTPVKKIVGKSLFEIYGVGAMKLCKDNKEIIDHGLGKYKQKEKYCSFPGEERWLEMNKIPFMDLNKNIEGVIIFAEEIKNAEARASIQKEIKSIPEKVLQVMPLKGLITICANCKSIRTSEGFWQMVESYISEHSEAEFSHGICPECVKKLYPEYYHATTNGEKPDIKNKVKNANKNGTQEENNKRKNTFLPGDLGMMQ